MGYLAAPAASIWATYATLTTPLSHLMAIFYPPALSCLQAGCGFAYKYAKEGDMVARVALNCTFKED